MGLWYCTLCVCKEGEGMNWRETGGGGQAAAIPMTNVSSDFYLLLSFFSPTEKKIVGFFLADGKHVCVSERALLGSSALCRDPGTAGRPFSGQFSLSPSLPPLLPVCVGVECGRLDIEERERERKKKGGRGREGEKSLLCYIYTPSAGGGKRKEAVTAAAAAAAASYIYSFFFSFLRKGGREEGSGQMV